MRVQVVRVESGEGGVRTALKTAGGVVWTYWRGDPPTRAQFSDVELAITAPVTWGRQLEIVRADDTANEGATSLPPALGCLHAVLESIDQDGVALLRVGDGLVLVETTGAAPAPGTQLRLRACELTAYPA